MAKKSKNIEPAAVDESLGQLVRLARLIRQAGHVEGLHPVQWDALRYLAQANKFSNSPGALAKFMGATKGTISQTILVLVKKGLVTSGARAGDSRSVSLSLTDKGRALLEHDPLRHLEKSIAALGDKTRKRFSKALGELLEAEHMRQDEPSFGSCKPCRYFRDGGASEPDACIKFGVDLPAAEINSICVEHVAAN